MSQTEQTFWRDTKRWLHTMVVWSTNDHAERFVKGIRDDVMSSESQRCFEVGRLVDRYNLSNRSNSNKLRIGCI